MDKQLESITDCCPVCRSADIFIFLGISHVPVVCNRLWPTRKEALEAAIGNIRLAFCRLCGHIFNSAFDADLVEYSPDYENSLHFSPLFQGYARALAIRLIQKYDLHHKDIIEIGCGKGEFLKLFCELGHNRAIGFDPSFDPNRVDYKPGSNFSVVRDLYSQHYTNYKADMICCRQVLEHVVDPRHFLEGIRGAIGNKQSTIVFFEVPNVMFTLKDSGIWDLIYEHCAYYNASSLRRVFNLCGFEVLNLDDAFQGQFLCIEARPTELPLSRPQLADKGPDEIHFYIESFRQKYDSKVKIWQDNLKKIKHKNQRTVIWGAGSKGVSFLNIVPGSETIEFVIDINPHKHGMFIAGSGQKIVPPEMLGEIQPQSILIMNPVYQEEIQRAVKGLNLKCELAVV